MKSLNQFVNFDHNAFLRGKLLVFVSEKEYQKYEDGNPVGREGLRVELIIMKDETQYKDGRTQDNLYEKMYVKVPTPKTSLGIELNQPVKVVNVFKSSVYGKYRNELSLTAENVVPLEKAQSGRDSL